ncbi:MAG TPA: 2Fe-2S iron-sulfur cluster-binding protein, partial [Verrucomicrobiae bacterium]
MSSPLKFTLNGKIVALAECSPNLTLLEYLRGRGCTGTKEGCAEGDCGACSVALLERKANGEPAYRVVNSCLLPVALLADREVLTVEGMGCARCPHPVQQAMVDHLGSQCGYCTPGFIASLFEGYYRRDLSAGAGLDEQLAGN